VTLLFLLLLVSLQAALAQTGQSGPRPGWPCVPGRAIDPAYLEMSEATGGQVFLLQKNEAIHSGVVMMLPTTHPETLFRAVGYLTGTRTFEFPVDASVESLSVSASIQCRQTVAVIDPGGAEVTAANAVQSIELQAGKIVRVDGPGAGNWKVKIAGQGLFVFSVRAKTAIRLTNVRFVEPGGRPGHEGYFPVKQPPQLGVPQQLEASVSGPLTGASFQMIGASGETLGGLTESQASEGGEHLLEITPSVERFGILVEGTDESGRPVRRMYPKLFRVTAQQPARP
jgi:hypothetical protein